MGSSEKEIFQALIDRAENIIKEEKKEQKDTNTTCEDVEKDKSELTKWAKNLHNKKFWLLKSF